MTAPKDDKERAEGMNIPIEDADEATNCDGAAAEDINGNHPLFVAGINQRL